MHANTALPLAMQTFWSDATDFFESRAFADFCKEREGASKLAIAGLSRTDGVIRAIGSLGRLIAKRGGF